MTYFYIESFTKNRQLSLLLNETQGLKKRLQEDVAQREILQQNLEKENERLKKESLLYLEREKELNDKQKDIAKRYRKIYTRAESENKKVKRTTGERQKRIGSLKKGELKTGRYQGFYG